MLENCSDEGTLILELVGKEEDKNELTRKLSLLKGVTAKRVDLEVTED